MPRPGREGAEWTNSAGGGSRRGPAMNSRISLAMDRLLKRSRRRFASSMIAIVEKYNVPFDDDMIVTIGSMTYSTHDGEKVWGEESTSEIMARSYKITMQRQQNIETQKQQTSDFENEGCEAYKSFETELCGESQLNTDHKNNVELPSIKRNMESISIKKSILPMCSSGSPVKNKCRVKMDLLLEDGISSASKVLTVVRTKTMDCHQWRPFQGLDDVSLSGHPDVVLRKEMLSTNGQSALLGHQLSNPDASNLINRTTIPRNQSLWGNNESGFSSFFEMYESADEHCSWNNVTLADLYPNMVKTLSRLWQKASFFPLTRSNKYGYWHAKKGKLNTSKERIRNIRRLKLKSSFTVTDEEHKKHQLSMRNVRSNSPLDDYKHQTEFSENNATREVSSVCCDTNSMEIDSSGFVEGHTYAEDVGQNDMETPIFSRNISSEETFLVRSPKCTSLSLDSVELSHPFEVSCAIDSSDSGGVFNLTIEDKPAEMNTIAFKSASNLSLSFNDTANSSLQNNNISSVKTSNTLLGNHETKTFNKAISLQRSYSLSSLPVNRSQKFEDAFEKMYKELCSPILQKSLTFSNRCTSPGKSAKLCTSSFNGVSSELHQKCNDTFDSIYQQLCSEVFPKSPTFLRAANLKRKYEGLHMSETVNALVNSPVRTSPVVSRIKRAANFFSEDSKCSPIKRFKNLSDNSYRVCQKLPSWKHNLQKVDTTFTVCTPNINYWTSHMDSGFPVSLNHSFLTAPSTNRTESRIADVNENISNCLPSCVSLGGSQNCTIDALIIYENGERRISSCLNCHDKQMRSKNAKELVCKDYEGSSLQGYSREPHNF
ncbi:Holliday junction recognition protein isoform X1 [Anolis carolinensis]|uniref:Holliday junction recognition protein isoform X1 n=1 Tax=Anolis carolinensis TaxID=28377 RepID=UPI002F2B875A